MWNGWMSVRVTQRKLFKASSRRTSLALFGLYDNAHLRLNLYVDQKVSSCFSQNSLVVLYHLLSTWYLRVQSPHSQVLPKLWSPSNWYLTKSRNERQQRQQYIFLHLESNLFQGCKKNFGIMRIQMCCHSFNVWSYQSLGVKIPSCSSCS